MHKCKGCGGALLFDPKSQMMRCPYCNESYDPYEFEDRSTVEKKKEMEMTIYSCPQCGGQLGSIETSAAEFCSFCGTPVVLESRLEMIKRPEYIIPFKKTKEDCKDILHDYLKNKFFIPKEFKNCEVENFRGIYIPCWNYTVNQKDSEAAITLEKSDADYDYTYELRAELQATYKGIPHDASEAFADRISEILEPYNYRKRKPFNESFLAGFYSDIQDVPEDYYSKEAIRFANEHTYKEFVNRADLGDCELKEMNDEKMSANFRTSLGETECTLIPVWFMSYKKGKRIAYAAVNGESGKVFSDIPIDIPKVWLLALVLAIPIFFLLNAIVSMRASTALFMTLLLLGLTNAAFFAELLKIRARERDINHERAEKELSKVEKTRRKKSKAVIGIIIACIVLIIPVLIIAFIIFSIALVCLYLLVFALAIIGAIVGISEFRNDKDIPDVHGFVPLLIAALIGTAVYFIDPANDLYFYCAIILCMLAILNAFTNAWQMMNLYTTRPLPQLRDRG